MVKGEYRLRVRSAKHKFLSGHREYRAGMEEAIGYPLSSSHFQRDKCNHQIPFPLILLDLKLSPLPSLLFPCSYFSHISKLGHKRNVRNSPPPRLIFSITPFSNTFCSFNPLNPGIPGPPDPTFNSETSPVPGVS